MLCCLQVEFLKKLGGSVSWKIIFFLFCLKKAQSKSAKFGCIFQYFSQKAPSLSKLGRLPHLFIFIFDYCQSLRATQHFFFLALPWIALTCRKMKLKKCIVGKPGYLLCGDDDKKWYFQEWLRDDKDDCFCKVVVCKLQVFSGFPHLIC